METSRPPDQVLVAAYRAVSFADRVPEPTTIMPAWDRGIGRDLAYSGAVRENARSRVVPAGGLYPVSRTRRLHFEIAHGVVLVRVQPVRVEFLDDVANGGWPVRDLVPPQPAVQVAVQKAGELADVFAVEVQ